MQEFKIIFAGSMGAGKTTAIKALSDKEVISTDVANSDKKAHNKLLTTVGIDYGKSSCRRIPKSASMARRDKSASNSSGVSLPKAR